MAVQGWEKAHNPDILPQEGGRERECIQWPRISVHCPTEEGCELTAADAKSLKVFNQETSSMGRKESVESVLSVYKKKDWAYLAWLINEGLSLSKPVHKDWERCLLLQMYRGRCFLGVCEYSEEFLSKKANYPMGEKKNQKINPKSSEDFHNEAILMKHISVNPLVQMQNTKTLKYQLAFYYLNKSRQHSMNNKHLNKVN